MFSRSKVFKQALSHLIFPESGAKTFKKDFKNIDYNIYDTGHFALEEEGDASIKKNRAFMNTLN
ncbi:hypothetical protein [Aquimarina sp. RZ0]|uniref:hypothetical protein n=1 Tax=Aquimarina sp. RZ0 TaxID=2607730 RepID=UPI00210451B0|nr:hypothetical protein [Aquimarina sp. RZ0]